MDAYLTKPLDRQRLAALLERGGRDEAARLAHTLAGSASSLGAARLADAYAELETLARDDRQPSARLDAQLGAVRRERRAVETALADAAVE